MIITLLLAACTQAASPGPAALQAATAAGPAVQASITSPAVPSSTASTTRTAAATKTPRPTSFPTATPTPKPTVPSIYLALTNATEIPALGSASLTDLHGYILFRSQSYAPFAIREITEANDYDGDHGDNADPLTRFCHYADGYGCLWAVSPDGKSAGMLSAQDFDFNMYLPPNGPPQLVENGFITNHPPIQPVRLPEVCSQDPNSTVEQRCDWIRLSPDGRFLAFRYGPDVCGRSMQVIDRKTGEIVLEYKGGSHRFDFLPNGKLTVINGHCEGEGLNFFDPVTRQLVRGGGNGFGVWNPSRSILVVSEDSYMGNSSSLWGYNTKTGTVFHPEGKGGMPYDEHAIFLPDGKRFIYQHLKFGTNGTMGPDGIDTPAQIVRYDPISGQRTVLAFDPGYHYRLCQFDYQQPCPQQWFGDWIQVQRVPFTPIRPKGFDWHISSILPCFEEGKNCDTPPESFALNAHTGEIRPWDPASLPLAYPTPTPTPGPDLLGQPVYADPGGQFAFYVGRDGRSLWRLSKDGPAVPWVSDGEDFFYLP